MNRHRLAQVLLAIWMGGALSGQAVQTVDGVVYFDRPPRLVRSSATFTTAGSTVATYWLTLELLPDAGAPLQRVVLTQQSGSQTVRFRVQATRAYVGDRPTGQEIPLAEVLATKPGQMTIVFATPVQPGATLTLALYPVQNPTFPGVYQFGVTAYPQGERAYGQFLGLGRFTIRRRRGV